MAKEVLKIFGLPRTGTNYLTALIRENTDVWADQNKACWKHGAMSSKCTQLQSVVIVKHPLSWLVSYWRFMRKHPELRWCKSFRHFIRWERPDGHIEGECLAIHMWSFAYGYWLRYREQGRVEIVKYEDLLPHPEQVIGRLCDRLGIKVHEGKFVIPMTSMGPHSKGWSRAQILEYYGEKRWKAEYTPDLMQLVYRTLDPLLLKDYGYERGV